MHCFNFWGHDENNNARAEWNKRICLRNDVRESCKAFSLFLSFAFSYSSSSSPISTHKNLLRINVQDLFLSVWATWVNLDNLVDLWVWGSVRPASQRIWMGSQRVLEVSQWVWEVGQSEDLECRFGRSNWVRGREKPRNKESSVTFGPLVRGTWSNSQSVRGSGKLTKGSEKPAW